MIVSPQGDRYMVLFGAGEILRVKRLAVAMGDKYKHEKPGSWGSGAHSDGTPRVQIEGVPSYASTFIPGLLGEQAFGKVSGLPVDEEVYLCGQLMADFVHNGIRYEVKTTFKDVLMVQKRHASRADIFIAAKYLPPNRILLAGYAKAPFSDWNSNPGAGDWYNWEMPFERLKALG